MALHILIDGYNLLESGGLRGIDDIPDFQERREALVGRLREYKRLKRHPITVVFDGTNALEGMNRKSREGGIEIRFSRPGQTADALIKKMVMEEREKALVVTSDRDIARFAESKGASVFPSADFGKRIASIELFQEDFFNDMAEDLSESWTPTTKKKGPSRRASKKARRALTKVEKL